MPGAAQSRGSDFSSTKIPAPDAVRCLLWLLLLALAGPAAAAERIVVEAATVERKPVSLTLERPGTLVHRHILRVYNQEEGRLKQLPWFEGDQVKKGQLLMELDTRMLQSEIRKAEADLRLKQRRLTRLEKLVRQNAASTDEVAEARTELEVARAELEILRTRLGYTRVTAPFDGVVLERLAEPGDVKSRYSHLLTLADPGSLVIRFRLEGELLAEIAPQQKLSVRHAGREHGATLVRLFPAVDPVSRLGRAEAVFDRIPDQARSGDFVRVRITTRPRPRLLVPSSALRVDRRGEHVYLVDGERARRQQVRSGRRIGTEVEILEGLQPGQRVITRGFLGLKNGASITVLERGRQNRVTAP